MKAVHDMHGHFAGFDMDINIPFETDGFPEDAVGEDCAPCPGGDDQSVCPTPPDPGGPVTAMIP